MATTAHRTQLQNMINSREIDTVRQGVELFVSLNDPELWDEVLDEASFEPAAARSFGTGKRKYEIATPGRLVGTSFFRWNTRSSRWDELVLRMLVARSDSPLRAQVTGLDTGGMITSKEWLPVALDGMEAFPNLADVVVFTGRGELDVGSLDLLPSLRRLSIDSAHAYGQTTNVVDLPAMSKLEYLRLTSRATFALGDMPALREADVNAPVVHPERLAGVVSLTLGSEADEAIATHCPGVTEFTCTDLRSPVLSVPTGARLMNGSLKVHNPQDLGNLATLTNLQSLELVSGVAPVAGLESLAQCVDLRVLDIRGHRQITDIAFFEGHPNLRMIAAHNTGIEAASIPASMKAVVSFAMKPDLRKAVDRPAPGEKPAKRAATKLTPAQRKTMARLKKLFQATDMGSIMQGVELTVALDEPAIWDELLAGVTYELGGEVVNKDGRVTAVVGRFLPNKIFTGTLFRQPWLDVGLAHLVARSPSSLREQVTHLAIGQWSYSTSPLGALSIDGFAGFANLQSLQLLQAASCDLASLADIQGLEQLSLTGGAMVPAHQSLRELTGQGPVTFEANGRWPALTHISAAVDGLVPLAHGAPKLAHLTVPAGRSDLAVADFESLTALSMAGARKSVSITNCPALVETTASVVHVLEGVPSLQRLMVSRLDSFEVLANAPGLEELTIHGPQSIDKVNVRTPARLVGPLRLKAVRDLGNIGDLKGLQILQLSNVNEALSLAPLAEARELRVLDVRGCSGVSDLTPLEGLPGLRMVAIRDSGVQEVPPTLSRVVSRAKTIDLAAAASKPLPKASASKKKIPVPEAQRDEWSLVLAGIATSGLEAALAAIDRAASLDPAGLDFLLSKITVLRHQLRSRAPFRLSTRVFLVPLVARILSHLPADSVAAAPFRRMTKLVVEGEKRYGNADLLLDGLEAFRSLDTLIVHKCSLVRCESIVDSKISVLGIGGGSLSLGGLPSTLRKVVLDQVQSPDLAAVALTTIQELWLLRIIGDLALAPLVDSPPKQIRYGLRAAFQTPIDIPGELADRCSVGLDTSIRQLLRDI